MDGEAWWATVHGVTKSRTRLSDFTYLLAYRLRKNFFGTIIKTFEIHVCESIDLKVPVCI